MDVSFVCSYFLYNISQPDKEGYPTLDLKPDKDVQIVDSLNQTFTPKQQAVERVIVKAFVHHRCDAIITDQLRAMFTSKLWRMSQAIRDGGGRRSHSVIERWKLTKWKIEFTDNEVVPYSVGNKKQQNPIIVSALNHHTVLEDKLGDTTKKLNEVTNQLQILEKSQKRLSVSLIDKENKRPKRKAWSDCSLQQQRKQKRQITGRR